MSRQPIGVFDSGIGGLSVVRHLRLLMPLEDIVYFGDTARVPYGSKSKLTIAQFANDDARFLLQFNPKLIVVACNTVSALAMDELRRNIAVPLIGVVEPGARAAGMFAAFGPVAVLGTEATVNSGAYPTAIHEFSNQVEVIQQACPLFVPIVEEGRGADDPIARLTVETYLAPVRAREISVCVLGCTHYPLLREAIESYLGPNVKIVDSGAETAIAARAALLDSRQLSETGPMGSLRCYVSDNPARFRDVGSRFMNLPIENVEFVEAERYIAHAV